MPRYPSRVAECHACYHVLEPVHRRRIKWVPSWQRFEALRFLASSLAVMISAGGSVNPAAWPSDFGRHVVVLPW